MPIDDIDISEIDILLYQNNGICLLDLARKYGVHPVKMRRYLVKNGLFLLVKDMGKDAGFFLTDEDIKKYIADPREIYNLSLKYCVKMSFIERGLKRRSIMLVRNPSIPVYFAENEIEQYKDGEISVAQLAKSHKVSLDRMTRELMNNGASWERHRRNEANESQIIMQRNEMRALSKKSSNPPNQNPKPQRQKFHPKQRTIDLSKEDVDAYINGRISVYDLALNYGINRDIMYNHLRQMGIFVNKNPKNTPAKFKLADEDISGFLNRSITIASLAEKHNVSTDAIKSRLSNTKATSNYFTAQSITADDIAAYKSGSTNLMELTNKYETTNTKMMAALLFLGIYR